jgi:4-cresol dehydrogenase (hydroxylating)
MDAAAATFDFNDSATLRLHTRLKNMLDPNGILSPGKQGVWPAARSGALQA